MLVGFSAVLFGLKVILTHGAYGDSRIMFLPVTIPTRYVVWAELLIIHFLVPHASFLGHLCGIGKYL